MGSKIRVKIGDDTWTIARRGRWVKLKEVLRQFGHPYQLPPRWRLTLQRKHRGHPETVEYTREKHGPEFRVCLQEGDLFALQSAPSVEAGE